MAQHDTVVKYAARYFEERKWKVQADHLIGYEKPPTFEGPRGGSYRPDIYIPSKNIVVEVEPFDALKHSISQIKAFDRDKRRCKRLIVILSSGTEWGVPRIKRYLKKKGVDCEVWNYKELPNWPYW